MSWSVGFIYGGTAIAMAKNLYLVEICIFSDIILEEAGKGLQGRKPSKSNGITKLFGNKFYIPLPKVSLHHFSLQKYYYVIQCWLHSPADLKTYKLQALLVWTMLLSLQLCDTSFYVQDDEQLRVFNNQIAEDKKIIVSRHNLVELHKVLEKLFEL